MCVYVLTHLMPPEDVHFLGNVGIEEVRIIYRRRSPIYHGHSIGTCTRTHGKMYSRRTLSLAPKIAMVPDLSRLPRSPPPFRDMKVIELVSIIYPDGTGSHAPQYRVWDPSRKIYEADEERLNEVSSGLMLRSLFGRSLR